MRPHLRQHRTSHKTFIALSMNNLVKTIVIFHDESIFSLNEDQRTQWSSEDMRAIKPKGIREQELWFLILWMNRMDICD